MFATILSVLLMGLLPVGGISSGDQVALSRLAVSAPLPLLASASVLMRLPSPLSASGILLTDLGSGQALFSVNARHRRPTGSLTKLMTALLIAEHHELSEVVTVPADVALTQGSVVHLVPGERYTVGDLLTALLVPSANDAAAALAVFHSGSRSAFVEAMNERAGELGLRDTSYANPEGLDDPAQWSTPQDLTWLASFVLRRPELERRLSLSSAVIQSLGGREIALQTTNLLLRSNGPVVAGKTGTTDDAGQCLLTIVREGQREFVAVLLGSRERWADMRSLLAALPVL
ncbi:MAG: serine hydrolase [Candidatus Peribacteraceae bacterium]|jgi:D-alanyl-D-alanine carboxypeptidase